MFGFSGKLLQEGMSGSFYDLEDKENPEECEF